MENFPKKKIVKKTERRITYIKINDCGNLTDSKLNNKKIKKFFHF